MIRAIVTDIEGTTSSIAFVHEVLFPYAAKALPAYLRANAERHAECVQSIRNEANEPEADLERVVDILLDWIVKDRKATPLKTLQGFVWEDGYANGAFKGHVYEDAASALRRWRERGLSLYVYSSGSIKAQKLLFGCSEAGDLTPVFSGYFDTTTGPKREKASYDSIARSIDSTPEEILFLSDVTEELDAAAAAGMQTMQLVRTDDVKIGSHRVAKTFNDVLLDE